MANQDLREFSNEVKRGFVEALGDNSYFSSRRVIRFFTDELSGEECAIVWNGKEEICVSEDEAYDILAEEQRDHDRIQLMMERG